MKWVWGWACGGYRVLGMVMGMEMGMEVEMGIKWGMSIGWVWD